MRAAWALLLACAVSGAGGEGAEGGAGGERVAGPVPPEGARFRAEATVLLGAADARGAELGYRLAAALAVRALPLPGPDPAVLLHYTVGARA